jgi:hypothetical protein
VKRGKWAWRLDQAEAPAVPTKADRGTVLQDELVPERLEDGRVERSALLQVGNGKVEVIDHGE